MAETREIQLTHDDLQLAGSLWLPDDEPEVLIVMHPGSGPEDRHNSGYFVPLREGLLARGYAVGAFDKRGVGGSGGRWQDAPIETQARDLLAAVSRLSAEPELDGVPTGLFGHSQGGWVVMEAGAREEAIAFLILNSGPGVSPSAQERYATRTQLERSGADGEVVELGVARYDLMVRLARALTSYSDVEARQEELAPHLPKDASIWHFWISILDYEPRSALSRTHASILALFGGDDAVVPVPESISAMQSVVPPTRLDIEVFEGADHRIQVGEPPRLAAGYMEKIASFLEAHSQS